MFVFHNIFALPFIPLADFVILHNTFVQEVAEGEKSDWEGFNKDVNGKKKRKQYLFQERREPHCGDISVLWVHTYVIRISVYSSYVSAEPFAKMRS